MQILLATVQDSVSKTPDDVHALSRSMGRSLHAKHMTTSGVVLIAMGVLGMWISVKREIHQRICRP